MEEGKQKTFMDTRGERGKENLELKKERKRKHLKD